MKLALSQTGTIIQFNNGGVDLPQKSKAQNEAKQTMGQAWLYMIAPTVTFLFAYIWDVVRKYFWLYLLYTTFLPLLGFFNFFIFIRPRVVMILTSKPELSLFQAFITAIITKEVTSSSGRRHSIGIAIRRRSQTFKGGIPLQAEVLREEEEKYEIENGLE